MKVTKVVNERFDHDAEGVSVAGGINAVVSATVNEPGGATHVSSKQKQRIVQRKGKTTIVEEHQEGEVEE